MCAGGGRGKGPTCICRGREERGKGKCDCILVCYEFPDSTVVCAKLANPVEQADFTGVDEGKGGVNLWGI